MSRGVTRWRRRGRRRQIWWALEVLGTAVAAFTAAGSVALAARAEGWWSRLAPLAVAVGTAMLLALLVTSRPRRWRREVS